jgi:hypothetical protein
MEEAVSIGTILFVVIITAGVGMAVFHFIKGAGPDWLWQGGRKDLVRSMLFREDGSWRRYGKFGILLFWLAIACVAYVVGRRNAG